MIDTGPLVLLIVGAAGRSYIAGHRSLGGYDADDYDLLTEFIELGFSEIVVVPHVLAEVSNLASQTYRDARRSIRSTLAAFTVRHTELQARSSDAARHELFLPLGLTDAAILVACMSAGSRITLLTSDQDLATAAEIAGVPALRFDDLRG